MKMIKDIGMKPTKKNPNGRKYHVALYECPLCFNHFETRVYRVNSGKSNSCQSCSTRKTSTTHGKSTHPLHSVWKNEKQRCNNPNNPRYCDYGGRGIIFDEKFNDFIVWFDYVLSLDNAMTPTYTIDRIDNNDGYKIGNLRWASKSTQSQNTRTRKDNTSGTRGISWDKNRQKWMVRKTINKKTINLGRYESLAEAQSINRGYNI